MAESRSVTEPTETPRRLFRKAARGKDEATPLIVISGMTMLIAGVVGLIAAVALALYFLI
jgi:preprotein translocase subunit Sss1